MTVKQAVEYIDAVKPNAFPTWAKVLWLAELEGRLAADVFLIAPLEIAKHFDYRYPEDMETELLVAPPHDDVYTLWLEAKVDYANGEYDKYQNTMQSYNEHYANFLRWFAQLYDPVQGYISEEGRAADGLL